MKSHRIALAITLVAALTACGGSTTGGGIAVSPPPPLPAPTPTPSSTPTFTGIVESSRTALPTTPANTSGTYSGPSYYRSSSVDSAGIFTATQPTQLVEDAAATLQVDAASRTYTLTLAVAPEPGDPAVMSLPATSPLGFHVVYLERYSDGSTRPGYSSDRVDSDLTGGPRQALANGEAIGNVVPAGTYPDGSLRAQSNFVTLYNVGHSGDRPRYLSLAQWTQTYLSRGSDNVFHPVTSISGGTVFGQRTAAGDIPASGRAIYALTAFFGDYFAPDEYGGSEFVDVDGETVLTVNFATKALDATFDFEKEIATYELDPEGHYVLDSLGDPIVNGNAMTVVHATGSTTLSTDGDFTLPLTGQGNIYYTALEGPGPADLIRAVDGSIVGAFFGPQAAEVGGIWNLPMLQADGSVVYSIQPFYGLIYNP
jgi:hypothetical protein